MKLKTILVLVITLFTSHLLMGQRATLNDIKKMSLKNAEAIVENDEVKGYMAFYRVEKKNMKESIYKLVIYDNNLNPKYDIDLVKPNSTVFMESAYNGITFCFSFLDLRAKSISYVVYDKEGKSIGTYTKTSLSRLEMNGLIAKTRSESEEFYGGLASVPGKGFVLFNLDPDKGKTTHITMIDNNAKELWMKTLSGSDKDDIATAIPIASSKKMIVTQVYTRESFLSQSIKTWFLNFQSTEDGSNSFQFDCKTGKYQWSVNGVSFEGDDIYVFGEYFKPGINPFKGESDGLFFLKLDQKGNIVQESYSGWTKDINRAVPNALTTENGKRIKLAIHKIIHTSDGKYFGICEQYKITADALGIASNVMNGGYSSSVTKMVLLNIVLLEFDANMKITDGQIIDKNNTSVQLVSGLEFYGSSMIAYYLKSSGQFDYKFATVSPDHSTFNATYINFDKEKMSKIAVVGNISYTKDKKIVKDVIRIDDKPTDYIALPGKPGYVGIMEYFKKLKTIEFRLEKLNL